MLRLSIDEREKDDIEGSANALPFVIGEDLAEQYGDTFEVSLDEHQVPTVAVPQ